jgi:hypothetical protein
MDVDLLNISKDNTKLNHIKSTKIKNQNDYSNDRRKGIFQRNRPYKI